MNDFGQLASDIITYDFPNDTGTYGTGYISGWLEVNLGELNGLTHEEFSGNATGAIEYAAGSGLMPIEKKIFRHTSSAFIEDPLRVIRFARFKSYNQLCDFELCSETIDCFKKVVNAGWSLPSCSNPELTNKEL